MGKPAPPRAETGEAGGKGPAFWELFAGKGGVTEAEGAFGNGAPSSVGPPRQARRRRVLGPHEGRRLCGDSGENSQTPADVDPHGSPLPNLHAGQGWPQGWGPRKAQVGCEAGGVGTRGGGGQSPRLAGRGLR